MFRTVRATTKAIASTVASRVARPTAAATAFRVAKPSATIATQARLFSAAKGNNNKLSEALLAEIDHEESNQEADKDLEDVQSLILKSFKLEDKAGDGVVKLTRNHGAEKIEVIFDVQDTAETDGLDLEDSPEGEDGEDAENAGDLGFGINFQVTITKGEHQLIVNCVGSDGITVQNIRHIAASRGAEDNDIYAGPNFDDLDDTVTEAFLDYLEERKIDADLGYFVLAYSREKEQKEYVNWLKNIQNFVSK